MAGFLGMALLVAGTRQAHAEAVKGVPPLCPDTAPGPNQAYVWTLGGFNGVCCVLDLGTTDPWSAWDANHGLPNDSIRSAKTGTNVSLVLFWNSFYTKDNGGTFNIPPNTWYYDLGSWDDRTSAARVQTFGAGACNAYGNGTFNLYTDINYGGDCNALVVGPRCYADPFEMGFRNDTMSSFYNSNTQYTAGLYIDANFQRLWGGFSPLLYGNAANYGGNDALSSMSGDWTRSCP
jgi:hypothetical protein